ncbi:TPA: hypothetical protein N0F65_003507 [Lagenidium giganteum]|uniref:DUF218 domain-containing protein n=1 Tax=Lagenidium giganteum TaxID=4803 RepID=A0AAV2YK28_9STRA|nr:TPA: hypothetical protein N0F65_003507 [Lagenidium giganteum]
MEAMAEAQERRRSSGKMAVSSALGVRPRMKGTLLPQDSLRARKAGKEARDNRLLAAAGLDLFRRGLAFDGVLPELVEPRHPAVTPNLNSIPENGVGDSEDMSSQAIVIIGGSLNNRGEVGPWLPNRIACGIQLYWKVMKTFAEQQANALCYVIPISGDANEQAVMEEERTRESLVGAGISSHHIVMDCTASSMIENTVLLARLLARLHIQKVHVVTSEFQAPRVKLCIDGVLGALDDLGFSVAYYCAPDDLSSAERAQRDMAEQTLMLKTQKQLHEAINQVRSLAQNGLLSNPTSRHSTRSPSRLSAS